MGDFPRQQHAGGLGEDLAEDHPGHDGSIGKMSLKEEFIALYGIVGNGLFFPFFRVVQKEHRLPVGKDLFDFFSVHGYLRSRNSSVPYSTT